MTSAAMPGLHSRRNSAVRVSVVSMAIAAPVMPIKRPLKIPNSVPVKCLGIAGKFPTMMKVGVQAVTSARVSLLRLMIGAGMPARAPPVSSVVGGPAVSMGIAALVMPIKRSRKIQRIILRDCQRGAMKAGTVEGPRRPEMITLEAEMITQEAEIKNPTLALLVLARSCLLSYNKWLNQLAHSSMTQRSISQIQPRTRTQPMSRE